MKPITNTLVILAFLSVCNLPVFGNNDVCLKCAALKSDSLKFNFGISLRYFYNPRSATNFSLSFAVGVGKSFPMRIEFGEGKEILSKTFAYPGYQAAVNFYVNGIGDNIFDRHRRFNFDFVNSFIFHLGFNEKKENGYFVPIRLFNSQTASMIENPFGWSFGVGSNLVLNNLHRNQVVGVVGANLGRRFTFSYYNDGGPLLKLFGDGYDRWWTGGGGIEIYFGQDNTALNNLGDYLTEGTLFILYDRFTGNVQDGFEVANYLSLPFIPAKDVEQNFLNRGQLTFGYFNRIDDWQASFSLMGKFKWDVQDLIHKGRGQAHHLSLCSKKQLFGVGYSKIMHTQKIKP